MTVVDSVQAQGRSQARWVSWIVFAALFLWSSASYLVIRVDSDIVAEAIQVQRWLDSPGLVLSYPGQLYGGVLEYPLIALMEDIFPGNVYALTFLRIFYLPFAGFLTVLLVHRMFPNWRLWPFVPVVIAGPAVLHSMMAIKDLYPFSWLIGMLGVFIIVRQWSGRGRLVATVAGGVLCGLAVYQHPTTALVVIPLLVLGLARFRLTARMVAAALGGFLLGLVPLAIARFGQSGTYIAYRPSRSGFPDVRGALGLAGEPDPWRTAVVPNGWGVEHTNLNDLAFPFGLQLAINAALVIFLVICAVVAVRSFRSFSLGDMAPPSASLAAMWVAAVAVLTAITVVVPPVFFYGAALAIPAWVTLVAGMNHIAGSPGVVAAYVIVVLAAITSLGTVLALNPSLPGAVGFKNAQAQIVQDVAQAIEDEGIDVVFGDYWEVLPIVHASSARLSGVTLPVNRFASPSTDGGGSFRVAVATGYTVLPPGLERWPAAEQSVGFMDGQCIRMPSDVAGIEVPIRIYECPFDTFELLSQPQ